MTSVAPAKLPCLEGRGMAHHWQYTTPSGPTVAGVCKHCGASRRDRVDPLDGGLWRDYHKQPAVSPIPSPAGAGREQEGGRD